MCIDDVLCVLCLDDTDSGNGMIPFFDAEDRHYYMAFRSTKVVTTMMKFRLVGFVGQRLRRADGRMYPKQPGDLSPRYKAGQVHSRTQKIVNKRKTGDGDGDEGDDDDDDDLRAYGTTLYVTLAVSRLSISSLPIDRINSPSSRAKQKQRRNCANLTLHQRIIIGEGKPIVQHTTYTPLS